MAKSPDIGKFSRYYAAVRFLEAVGKVNSGYQKTDLKSHPRPEIFLERMRDFLDLLGSPEKGFRYIHITGTSGKGSVAAAVHGELVRAGKKSGLFTSPFTVSTIEKIQVGDRYIDPLVFRDITETLKPAIEQMAKSGRNGTPSYFEMIFAIALIYFQKMRCEYAVLEVGLGGRYDATNIIISPLITAVTNIGLDHTQILGSKRSDIAKDKAGIIKPGSRFFTTESDPKILKIFKGECEKTGAVFQPIRVAGLDYDSRNRSLAGHICANLGIIDTPKKIKTIPSLPARFEIVEEKPLIIIDGAHNPSKLESTIYNLKRLKFKNLTLIMVISAEKDWKNMVRMIAPLADRIYACQFKVMGRKSVDAEVLAKTARKHTGKPSDVYCRRDPVEAFTEARKNLSKGDALLVVGSFYLVGFIRALYCSEDRILRNRNSEIKIS
jgi:dihydrofolate synthase/folylpolyglutamate synthase